MRIVIDARAYAWAGVGRYVRNLLLGLGQVDRDNTYLVLLGANDKKLISESGVSPFGSKVEIKYVESSYYSWREQVSFWWQLANIRADLWHFPNFNIPVLFNKPYVVTVHDTTRFIFPGQISRSLLRQAVYEQVFKHAVEKAKGVIFVSRATEASLQQLPIRVNGAKAVIYEGVEDRFKKFVTAAERHEIYRLIGSGNKYLLYAGVWMSHKNIPRLLKAFADLLKTNKDITLVMTGELKRGYVNARSLADKFGISKKNIVFLGNVDDRLLPALYAQAEILLFPSLYEGFGLPAIEAAAAGIPVIASNNSSFPEVMGEAAVYVNPEDVGDITDAVKRLLSDSELRKNMTQRGMLRAKMFDWSRCAWETKQVYEQVASKEGLRHIQ